MTSAASVLFVFPHPDDEFAVTAWIRDFTRTGTRVVCAYMTDGAFAGQSAERRERESVLALQELGVPASDVYFLGSAAKIADGSLHSSLDQALQILENLLQMQQRPVEIFCPAWEGGHQDHDAGHLLAIALARRLEGQVKVWQFPLYTGARLPGPFFRVMSALAENGPIRSRRSTLRERLAQIRFCLGFPSQWRSWIGLLPFITWRMLTDGRFQLQPVCVERAKQSPHSGRLLYERRGFLTHASFRAVTAPFIQRYIDTEQTS